MPENKTARHGLRECEKTLTAIAGAARRAAEGYLKKAKKNEDVDVRELRELAKIGVEIAQALAEASPAAGDALVVRFEGGSEDCAKA